MTSSKPYDVVILGGGFSGLATAANLVDEAQFPLSIAIVSRDPEGQFGPAYSTPRMEHLLNVRAKAMGLFADNHAHFTEWLQAEGIAHSPEQYMPRPVYGRYLKAVLAETREIAKNKQVRLEWFQGEVEDIRDDAEHFSLLSGDDFIMGHHIVLAVGNTLKAQADAGPEKLVTNPWHYDFATLSQAQKSVAIIGSGLTAADTIISILESGWKGHIKCFSGASLLPRAHLKGYDDGKRAKLDPGRFLSQRLSHILHELRKEIKAGVDWRYVIDGLRPFTQDIWRSLPETDRRRLAGKYFTLWSVHRHRFDAGIAKRIDAARQEGVLEMVKARVTGAESDGDRIALSFQNRAPEAFDLVFKCTGVNYRVANNPLLQKLAERGYIKFMAAEDGIRASDEYLVHRKKPNAIYTIGAPLFGQLFETIAVPELREQARVIAKAILRSLAVKRLPASAAGG